MNIFSFSTSPSPPVKLPVKPEEEPKSKPSTAPSFGPFTQVSSDKLKKPTNVTPGSSDPFEPITLIPSDESPKKETKDTNTALENKDKTTPPPGGTNVNVFSGMSFGPSSSSGIGKSVTTPPPSGGMFSAGDGKTGLKSSCGINKSSVTRGIARASRTADEVSSLDSDDDEEDEEENQLEEYHTVYTTCLYAQRTVENLVTKLNTIEMSDSQMDLLFKVVLDLQSSLTDLKEEQERLHKKCAILRTGVGAQACAGEDGELLYLWAKHQDVLIDALHHHMRRTLEIQEQLDSIVV